MPNPAESLARLYQATVLAHSRQPHNFRRMAGPDRQATGNNPLCGDQVTLFMREADGIVTDISFDACGCAISLASSSMLTDLVRGLATAEARRLAREVATAFNGPDGELPGDLAALAGVRNYPARVRCATLPWRTLGAALESSPAPVSTE